MPIKKEELEETTGPINIVGFMQDGMAYTMVELYELVYEESIESKLADFEKGATGSEKRWQLMANLSLMTMNVSNLNYTTRREYEKGTLGRGIKDDSIYYYKK